MIIRVFSFDFDGSLFHKAYRAAQNKDVVKLNQKLLDALKAEASLYSTIFTLIGSNRQSQPIDAAHHYTSSFVFVGSCFPAIKRISDYLNTKLVPFLLADLYGNLVSGTSYRRAMENLEKPDLKIEHQNCTIDEYKITLLYAQIHHMAYMMAKLPKPQSNAEIVFDFYDDREDILNELGNFFNQHQMLLPNNVTLRLHQYAGELASPLHKIKGSGFIDTNYGQTVKDMVHYHQQIYPKEKKLYIPMCFSLDALTHRAPFKPERSNSQTATNKSQFAPCSFFSSSNYKASYMSTWNRPLGESKIRKAKALLKDYTKENFFLGSFAGRVLSGHWNRHHVRGVSRIITQINENKYTQIEDVIAALKDLNPTPGGSLCRRIQFIEDQIDTQTTATFSSRC